MLRYPPSARCFGSLALDRLKAVEHDVGFRRVHESTVAVAYDRLRAAKVRDRPRGAGLSLLQS
jgi:hypothetical protein